MQLPLAEGWTIDTVRAVTGLEVEPGDAGVPLTTTQSPLATVEAATETVWLKVVDVVQLTVVWPDCGFCTSIDGGVSAATWPMAP